jgi:L-ascorbate metabolism protein UlaG (beta-lactamase superfamily)
MRLVRLLQLFYTFIRWGDYMIDRVQWLGHASFRIQGPPLIYINPWRVARNAFHADVILVTNDLFDHCSPADVEKLRGPDTLVVANPGAAALLGEGVTVLRPWQCINWGEACITAVSAYTFNEHYPVSKGGLGFIISLGHYDIYYAGLTDLIPELECVHADIVILPVAAGPGTLNVDRAVQLVNRLRPQWVVPSHWGTFGGTHLDVQVLERALSGRAEVVNFEKAR